MGLEPLFKNLQKIDFNCIQSFEHVAQSADIKLVDKNYDLLIRQKESTNVSN